MSVRQTLDYLASFRPQWNQKIEKDLLGRFRLDPKQKVSGLSKGQRTQLALTGAISADPEMLVLDEPTSGLDPIVRREFIQTVIGAYQEIDPERRTIFVSTHLISEFEGLIDEFTIVEGGRSVLSLTADAAREQFQRVRARFAQPAPAAPFSEAREVRREGRELELIVRGGVTKVVDWLRAQSPEDMSVEALTLEEVFVSSQNSATA
jgi:ABC-2 type transport system ATP-binding protein